VYGKGGENLVDDKVGNVHKPYDDVASTLRANYKAVKVHKYVAVCLLSRHNKKKSVALLSRRRKKLI
jgi:hypothetical protein